MTTWTLERLNGMLRFMGYNFETETFEPSDEDKAAILAAYPTQRLGLEEVDEDCAHPYTLTMED